MELFYREVGQGEPLIILHGLFGSSDNWLTISRKISDKFKIYLLDLRNHGKSPHSETHDYPSMVDDLFEFMEKHKIDKATILGHSMGGKVAMRFALQYPHKVNKLIVIDIAPKVYKIRHNHILDALLSLNLSEIKSRKEADDKLADKIRSREVRQFLLKNLYRKDDLTFDWRLNIESLSQNLTSIKGTFSTSESFNNPTLFIKGENSNYILPEDHELIYRIFVNSKIVTINGAGHWTHSDNLEDFMICLNAFLYN